MRILLAEDERDLGQWLARALEQAGFRVDWLDDGRLVERALAAGHGGEPFDALVLDLGLPGRDGHEVLKRIRALDQRLPVLILTARDSLAERVSTLNEGADDFLAKPFALAELEARLTALIRRALEHSGGNRAEAARILGIHRQLLYEKLRQHGIDVSGNRT